MTSPSDIGAAVAAAARSMSQPQSLQQTLEAIVEAARSSVPGFDHVGISTVERHGVVETRAATGDLVERLDMIQYGLGEGPCVDTLRGEDAVVAPHIAHDDRWPRYVPLAVEQGLRSQLAVRLYLDPEGTVGGLNLYSTTSEEVDDDAVGIAELFATHAAIAVGHATEWETLNEAMRTRKVIGQAIGIIMERFGVDEDRAFAYLIRTSSASNIKLRDVAQQLVDHVNSRGPRASRAGTGV